MKVALVLDTETLGVKDRRVYDLGYVIVSLADGKILKSRDYVSKQIYDNLELFKSAYYANKRPIYESRLADGYLKKMWWGSIMNVLAKDIETYGVDGLFAYNSSFDLGAIKVMCEQYKAKQNPTADGIIDIWKDNLVDPNLTQTEEYIEFCKVNNYLTKAGKCRATAEIVYRYLTRDGNYTEQHTALEDAKIEADILRFVLGY